MLHIAVCEDDGCLLALIEEKSISGKIIWR